MPTADRRPYIRAAIACFLAQTYEPRELVILDDGNDRILDLIPEDARIRYYGIEDLGRLGKVTVGRKRNLCCEIARGELIFHADDDDYQSPTRIADQVERLAASGKPITGYSTLLFWDRTVNRAKRYRAHTPGYVCGTSLAYTKPYWRARPFRDQQEASDNAFVYPALRSIAAADGSAQMVARIHDCHHTSSKKGITQIVPKELLPESFWDNERLIA